MRHFVICYLDFDYEDVVDLKPPGANEFTELTEVITSAEFHPDECNMFAYSTNTGVVRLCDMRQQALCDQHAKCKPVMTNFNCQT
jgi:hypothetical protein